MDEELVTPSSRWSMARALLGLILILSALLWIGTQTRLPLLPIFYGVSTAIFLCSLIALIAILGFVRGLTGLREGLTVLPIPIAISAAIVHLIFFLLSSEPSKALEAFAISLAPLIWVAVFMVIGLSLPIAVDTNRSPGDRPSGISIARDCFVITFLIALWAVCASLLYDGISILELGPPGLLVPYLSMLGGIALMSKNQQPVWSFMGTCALKAGFAVSALTMTTYFFFLAAGPIMNETGSMLAIGWTLLLCTSVSITALQFMSVLQHEGEMAESIKRNWHLLELFGFYIFLSMAPPTIFDIFGF